MNARSNDPSVPPASAPYALDGIPVRLEEPLPEGWERVKEAYERAYLALALEKLQRDALLRSAT